MSEQREITDAKTGSIIAQDKELVAKHGLAGIKAKMVEILDRGIVHDRLFVALPNDLHGEWVPNNKQSIMEYETLGFEIADRKELGVDSSVHEEGDNRLVVGDVIFMVCSKFRKDALDEIRLEKYLAMHGRKGERTQAEEKEFLGQAKGLEKFGIGSITESDTKNVTMVPST